MKRTINDILKLACSLALGGGILFWMYRDFNFGSVREVLLEEMNWWWMLLSFPFGILAQASLGILQSPRGERLVLPIFTPSGWQFLLNCCEKKRR